MLESSASSYVESAKSGIQWQINDLGNMQTTGISVVDKANIFVFAQLFEWK